MGYSTVEKDRHGFIQFTNNITNETKYIKCNIEEMSYTKYPSFFLLVKINYQNKKWYLI